MHAHTHARTHARTHGGGDLGPAGAAESGAAVEILRALEHAGGRERLGGLAPVIGTPWRYAAAAALLEAIAGSVGTGLPAAGVVSWSSV